MSVSGTLWLLYQLKCVASSSVREYLYLSSSGLRSIFGIFSFFVVFLFFFLCFLSSSEEEEELSELDEEELEEDDEDDESSSCAFWKPTHLIGWMDSYV